MISVVVGVHDEERSVALLHDELASALDPIDEPWEVVFADDGSTDGAFSPRLLAKLAKGFDLRGAELVVVDERQLTCLDSLRPERARPALASLRRDPRWRTVFDEDGVLARRRR